MLRWLIVVVVLVGLVLAAIFVWPTRYKYTEVTMGGNNLLIRRDRLGHEVRVVTEEQRRNPRLVPKRLPREALQHIGGTVNLEVVGDRYYWKANLYNASDWRITELILMIPHYSTLRFYRAQCVLEPRSKGICTVPLEAPSLDLVRSRPISPERIRKGETPEQRLWQIERGYGFRTGGRTPWIR